MSNKIDYVNAAAKILTESQLNYAMLLHHAIYETAGKPYDAEAHAMFEAITDQELETICESLDYNEVSALMEAAFLGRAVMAIPKIWKIWSKTRMGSSAMKSAAKYIKALQKGDFSKARKYKYTFDKKINKFDKNTAGLNRQERNKIFSRLNKKDKNTWDAIHSGKLTKKDLNMVNQEKYDNLSKTIRSKENELDRLSRQKQQEFDALNAKIANKEAEIKAAASQPKAAVLTKDDVYFKEKELAELKKQRDEFSFNDIKKKEAELNILKRQKAEFKTVANTDTVMPNAEDITSGMEGLGAAEKAASAGEAATSANGFGIPGMAAGTNFADVVLGGLLKGKKSKTSLLHKISTLGMAACGIGMVRDIWNEFGGTELMEKGIAMLCGGYVGYIAAKAIFGDDNNEAKVIGGISCAALAMYLQHMASQSGKQMSESQTNELVSNVASMTPEGQKKFLSTIGTTDPNTIQSIADANGISMSKLNTVLKTVRYFA